MLVECLRNLLLQNIKIGNFFTQLNVKDKTNLQAFAQKLGYHLRELEFLFFHLPEEKRYVTLKVSAAGIRNIDKKGLKACLDEAKEKGFIKNY